MPSKTDYCYVGMFILPSLMMTRTLFPQGWTFKWIFFLFSLFFAGCRRYGHALRRWIRMRWSNDDFVKQCFTMDHMPDSYPYSQDLKYDVSRPKIFNFGSMFPLPQSSLVQGEFSAVPYMYLKCFWCRFLLSYLVLERHNVIRKNCKPTEWITRFSALESDPGYKGFREGDMPSISGSYIYYLEKFSSSKLTKMT